MAVNVTIKTLENGTRINHHIDGKTTHTTSIQCGAVNIKNSGDFLDFETIEPEPKKSCKNCDHKLIVVEGEINGKKVSAWIHDPSVRSRVSPACVNVEPKE